MNGRVVDPMRAQSYRTQRAELPEDLWQPLYDRVQYPAAGTPELGFFSNPRGTTTTLLSTFAAGTWTSAAKVKTFRDTNMENQNVVPTKMFKCVGVSWGIIHANSALASMSVDREALRGGGFLRWRIVDKDVLFLPLVLIPEINPVLATATTVAGVSINATAGGGGIGVPMYKFPVPITINPYENFSVSLVFDNSPAIAQAADIVITLHSYMRRPT